MSIIVNKTRSRNIIKINENTDTNELFKSQNKIIEKINDIPHNSDYSEKLNNKFKMNDVFHNIDYSEKSNSKFKMNDIEHIIKKTNNTLNNINIINDNTNDNTINDNESDIFYDNKKAVNNDTLEVNKIIGKNEVPVTINKIDTTEIGNYEVSENEIPIQFINSVSGTKIDDINYNPLKIHNGIICDYIVSKKNNFIQLDENIIFSKVPVISEEETTLVTKKDLLGLIEEINTLKIKMEIIQEIINNINRNNNENSNNNINISK